MLYNRSGRKFLQIQEEQSEEAEGSVGGQGGPEAVPGPGHQGQGAQEQQGGQQRIPLFKVTSSVGWRLEV